MCVNMHMYIYIYIIYIYIYYIYIYYNIIYISKIRHLFLNELYFGFFQTFENIESLKVWKISEHNSFRNKCLIFYIYMIFSYFHYDKYMTFL